MKLTKRKKNNKGMTLIEIIIAMAILGIIGVTFLNVFGSGYIGIVSGGKHTKTAYKAQQIVEEMIITPPVPAPALTDSPEITFPGTTRTIKKQQGRQIVVTENYNGDTKYKTEITTFIAIPNP